MNEALMRAEAEWVVSLAPLATMTVTICRGVTELPVVVDQAPCVSPQSPKRTTTLEGSTLSQSTSAPQREMVVVRVHGGLKHVKKEFFMRPCPERPIESGVDPFAQTGAHQLSGCRSPTTHNVLQIDALRTRSNVDRRNENRT